MVKKKYNSMLIILVVAVVILLFNQQVDIQPKNTVIKDGEFTYIYEAPKKMALFTEELKKRYSPPEVPSGRTYIENPIEVTATVENVNKELAGSCDGVGNTEEATWYNSGSFSPGYQNAYDGDWNSAAYTFFPGGGCKYSGGTALCGAHFTATYHEVFENAGEDAAVHLIGYNGNYVQERIFLPPSCQINDIEIRTTYKDNACDDNEENYLECKTNLGTWHLLSTNLRAYEIVELGIDYDAGSCGVPTDLDCNGSIDRNELGNAIVKYLTGQITRTTLGEAISLWSSN